ncbi:MAG: anhydro-N-acetylmuramic acid kinase [Bacteroidales bacterium]
MQTQTLIGTMSGTSLDGLDICAAEFNHRTYTIIEATTIQYPEKLSKQLRTAHLLQGHDLAQLSVDFGIFCGKEIKKFIETHSIKAEYVASHGHTIFHAPQQGLTLQIGSGAHIAKESGLHTIYNIRNLDVAYGGQGAPLVPVGDEFLFSQYDYCLNIGGFANISTRQNNTRIAWDICGANILLNHFSKKRNTNFDTNGTLGKKGTIQNDLLTRLNNLSYFAKPHPKSLGREWIEECVLPIIYTYDYSIEDILRTLYEHIAIQIGLSLSKPHTQTLCTGGGTHNTFLTDLIKKYSASIIIHPSNTLIDYKEALIFAYLGYLRIINTNNCFASVTGAQQDVCGGELIYNNIR